jgi:hypothetical protein
MGFDFVVMFTASLLDGIFMEDMPRTVWSVALETYHGESTIIRNLVPNLWIEGCRVVSAADPLRSLVSVF